MNIKSEGQSKGKGGGEDFLTEIQWLKNMLHSGKTLQVKENQRASS